MNATLRKKCISPDPMRWKFIGGMLDVLPYNEWSEIGMREWLALFELGLRAFYDLPAEGR